MTSPSHKNHPTTQQPNLTRCKSRSLWKQLLAGALCLGIAGSLPATERAGDKPLDRLKQRSARQRWREMRGEWVPAPELKGEKSKGDKPHPAPFSSPFPNAKSVEQGPAPVPSDPVEQAPVESAPTQPATGVGDVPAVSEEPLTSPVPEPMEPAGTPEDTSVSNPATKPVPDPTSPQSHPGSEPGGEGDFGSVVIEPHVIRKRDRRELKLPNWPFDDDLDLIVPEPESNPLAESVEPPSLPQPSSQSIEPVEPPSAPTLQVAEVPQTGQADAPKAEPPAGEAAPAAPVPANDTTNVTSRPLPKLRSIREIQPFANYRPDTESKLESSALPKLVNLQVQGQVERNQAATAIYWHASNVTHNPLYFEDPGLERSGHTFSEAVQPFVSLGKFGTQVIALPYTIALDPVWKDESPLGNYRPGECAPKRHLALPLNREAVATAAAAYTGIIYLIP